MQFLTSVLLVCLSTCIRAHVEHRLNRRLDNPQVHCYLLFTQMATL